MLNNGASIHECEAYWHMNFSLINGCGTHENTILSFEVALASKFTNIIIVDLKSKQLSIRKIL